MIFLSDNGFDEDKIVAQANNVGLVDLEVFFSKNVIKFEYLESGGNMFSYCEKIAEKIGATSSIGVTSVDDCIEFFIIELPFSPRFLGMSWHMSKSPWRNGVEEYRFLRRMGYDKNIARASVGRLKNNLKKVLDRTIPEEYYKEIFGEEYSSVVSVSEKKETDEEFLA